MAHVTSQGLNIHYTVVGEGRPLLMHHGTMLSGAAWAIDGYLDDLRDHHRLILIDARGYGKSDKPHDTETALIWLNERRRRKAHWRGSLNGVILEVRTLRANNLSSRNERNKNQPLGKAAMAAIRAQARINRQVRLLIALTALRARYSDRYAVNSETAEGTHALGHLRPI